MVVLGTVFAVIIAKQLYGGLGQNPFNPAMIGYVVLLISFPVQMTSWLPPHEIAVNIPGFIDAIQVIFSGHTASGGDMNTLRLGIDGISQATPLDTFKTSVRAGHSVEEIMQYPISQRYSGGRWLAMGKSRLAGWRRVVAMAESDSLAYSPQLLSNAGVMRNVGLVVLTRYSGSTTNSSAVWCDHARRILYFD